MRVPDEILKCVAFIGQTVSCDEAPGFKDEIAGTGFFVALLSTRVPSVQFTYLVTANHIAEGVEGNFWLRLNTLDGGTIKLDCAGARWYGHPDGRGVDVAVFPMGIKPIDHLAVPPEMMLADRAALISKGIGPGDEVFLPGVFASSHGRKRNMPIIRTGNNRDGA